MWNLFLDLDLSDDFGKEKIVRPCQNLWLQLYIIYLSLITVYVYQSLNHRHIDFLKILTSYKYNVMYS